MNIVKDFYNDKFTRYLFIALILVGVILLLPKQEAKIEGTGDEFHFFFHPSCPHCKEQKPFNEELMQKYGEFNYIMHDVSDPEEAALLSEMASDYGITLSLGVPATFFGDRHFVGFDKAETTGKEIEREIQLYLAGEAAKGKEIEFRPEIDVPVLGEINVMNYSLPVLAILLGLIDGFNPCAMWVLVYLISLIMGLSDKRKIWFLVGTFVAASGILYFLFMTFWLNVFLIIGYLRPVTVLIGLGAIGVGILSLRDYFKKGPLECDIGDVESKKKTMDKMRSLVQSPLTWTSIIGIIALAFVVNSIEFACSSALPVIFTQVLAISNLSTLSYYAYISLYVLFFMLDDLIIFGLAAFAVSTSFGNKYAKYCKLVGGVLLLLIGIVLAFMPQVLAGF